MTTVSGDPVVSIAGDVMRDIAHELRQPLGTIESIAYYLTLVLPGVDEKIQDQLRRLQELVRQSDWILSNGLRLTEQVAIAPEMVDFTALVRDVISSQECPPILDVAADLPLVRMDPGLVRAMLENLLTLFRFLSSESRPAVVKVSAMEGGVAVEMRVLVKENTLGPGGALSLASARKIVAAHRGTLESEVHPVTGARVRVMLP
jgi:K+-sensing histidine kinase KdpD